jgi:UDP-N-acetylglucosamine--N-acetylmuramyl-(pentapeptide) pyrophosphoryl-undecaprenol N-acetylglucosamine transferase
MNIVIAGGGTGGHLFPGIAVAKELKKKINDLRVLFVGTTKGVEAKIIPREGFEIRFIRSEGLVGRGLYGSVRSALKIPLSLVDSFRLLKEVRPKLVFGVGGYSSGPLVLCAYLMGIPTIVHEQNTVPGFANKLLGKFVNTVAVTYHESMDFFPRNKTYLTGNPIREEIVKGERERGYGIFSLDKGRFTIFVFGGSRGASSINNAMGEALTYLKDYRDNIQFLHQTGEEDFESMKGLYHARGFKGTVIPFAYEMADAYAVSDLVISRAGATTLSEITACGKAVILVPYPFAAGNHQEANAKKLWDLGAAQVILDKGLNGKTLSDHIRHLLEDPEAIGEMERTSRSLGVRDATGKVVELITGFLKAQGHQDSLEQIGD